MLNHLPADLRLQVVSKSNPRRRRVTRRAARFISRTIRRLARRGESARTRVAIAYSKARRRGFKVPKARRNPNQPGTAFSESSAWKAVKAIGQRFAKFREVGPGRPAMLNTDGRELVLLAEAMLSQLKRGVHENPSLAVVGMGNPGVQCLGYVAGPLKYRRTGGKWPGWYQHRFKGRHAKLYAMPDGSLKIAAS